MYLVTYSKHKIEDLDNKVNLENDVIIRTFYSIDAALLFINESSDPLHLALFENIPLQLAPKK